MKQDMKKEEKRQGLLDAAYALFLEKGTAKTAISDIVDRAGVAKGTFYLYFKDKDAVYQTLIEHICYSVLQEARDYIESKNCDDPAEKVILLVEYVIEYFKRKPMVLRLLERNFSFPVLEQKMTRGDDPLYARMMADLKALPTMAGRTEDEMFQRLFIVLEMVGGVCYSSIVKQKPGNIDEMKPVLYDIIRKSL